MRRRDKEIHDPAAVLDVLARGEVLRLAMIADGAPYVVPLSYGFLPGPAGSPLAGLRLYVHSAPEGKKVDALRADPRVCFEVTVDVAVLPAARACDFVVRFSSVVGEGRARFLDDAPEKARALSLVASRYGAAGPIGAADAARVAVVEIAVETVSCKVSPPLRAS